MKTNKMIILTVIILSSIGLGYMINNNNNILSSFERNDIQAYSFNIESYSNNNNMINLSNYEIYTIEGISMNPTLMTNNKVLCDSSIKEYKTGMIALINNSNNNPYTQDYIHRIKAVYTDYIITQGDNNKYQDVISNYSQIECVVVGVLY